MSDMSGPHSLQVRHVVHDESSLQVRMPDMSGPHSLQVRYVVHDESSLQVRMSDMSGPHSLQVRHVVHVESSLQVRMPDMSGPHSLQAVRKANIFFFCKLCNRLQFLAPDITHFRLNMHIFAMFNILY